jgi:hypothetical protein
LSRRWLSLLGFLLIAGILTPVVQRVAHWLLIEPLAYYWWGVKQVVRVIPESFYWLFFVACFGLLAFGFFIRDIFIHRARPVRPVVQRGPVAYLAENIDRSGQSDYFKWVIANRLADIALRIRGGDRVNGPGNGTIDIAPLAAPEIQTYLRNGQLGSFMDYRQKRKWFSRKRITPFDVDVRKVIDYLESQMEQSSE